MTDRPSDRAALRFHGDDGSDRINALRREFEDWYVGASFDYAANPIGSHNCDLQWRAWLASRLAAAPDGAQVERTPADYAIEHGGYLANSATHFLETHNNLVTLVLRREEGEEVDDDVRDAEECVDEASSGLRSAIYEFEKRRDRALAQAQTPKPSQDAEDAAKDREDAELFRYIEKHVAAWHSNESEMPRFLFDPRFRNKDGDLCGLAVTGRDGVGSVSLRTALRIIQDAARAARGGGS